MRYPPRPKGVKTSTLAIYRQTHRQTDGHGQTWLPGYGVLGAYSNGMLVPIVQGLAEKADAQIALNVYRSHGAGTSLSKDALSFDQVVEVLEDEGLQIVDEYAYVGDYGLEVVSSAWMVPGSSGQLHVDTLVKTDKVVSIDVDLPNKTQAWRPPSATDARKAARMLRESATRNPRTPRTRGLEDLPDPDQGRLEDVVFDQGGTAYIRGRPRSTRYKSALRKAWLAGYDWAAKKWPRKNPTGGVFKIVDPETGQPWNIRVVPPGGAYGMNLALENEDDDDLIEFYDARQDRRKFGPWGQFVSRYRASTLTEDSQHIGTNGLGLDLGVPSWRISGPGMTLVFARLLSWAYGEGHKNMGHPSPAAQNRRDRKMHEELTKSNPPRASSGIPRVKDWNVRAAGEKIVYSVTAPTRVLAILNARHEHPELYGKKLRVSRPRKKAPAKSSRDVTETTTGHDEVSVAEWKRSPILERIVGQCHVGQPVEEVIAAVKGRMLPEALDKMSLTTMSALENAIKELHQENRDLYRSVMGGQRFRHPKGGG